VVIARQAHVGLPAGFGPISDGVPERIGEDDFTMPSAPRVSRPAYDADQTKRMRKARL
jgi:hypothetical protein